MRKRTHTFALLSLIAIGPATAQTPVPHFAYSPSIRIAVDPEVNGWQMETAVAGNALDRVLAVTIADTQRAWDIKSSAIGLFRQAGFERVQEVDLNLPQLSFPSSAGAMLVKDAFDPFACADLAGNLWVGAAAWSGPRGDLPHTSGVFVRRAPANGQLAPTTQWIYAKRWPDPEADYQLVDKPWIAYGKHPDPAQDIDGVLYTAWTDFDFAAGSPEVIGARIAVAPAWDAGGALNVQSVVLTPAAHLIREPALPNYFPFGAIPLVIPSNGRVVVVYGSSWTGTEIRAMRSDDAGISWLPNPTPYHPDQMIQVEPTGSPWILPNVNPISRTSGQKHVPSAAIDPRLRAGGLPNYIYAAYTVLRPELAVSGLNNYPLRIRVARSADGGVTWPQRVDLLPAGGEAAALFGDAFLPSIAVDALGVVHVTFIQTNDSEVPASSDQGFRWHHTVLMWPDSGTPTQSLPVEIGDRPTTADQRGGIHWLEYYGLTAVGQKVYATFSQHDPTAPGPRTIRAFLRRIDVGINEN